MRISNWLITLLLALSVGACGGGSPEATYPDPAKYPVRGIDISAHNGDMDFDKVKGEGYEFVFIKATEGGTFRDKKFVDNHREALAAGLKVGAYHFFRFDIPGYIQGLNFASAIEGRHLDLPAVIDLEEWTNPNEQATGLIVDRLGEMIDHLESRGHRVMVYTNKNGYERFIRPLPRSVDLWICSLGAEPDRGEWTFWQSTHRGSVAGSDRLVDINAFAGTRADWVEWLMKK